MNLPVQHTTKPAALPRERTLTAASERRDLILGLDLGQKRDYTAIAVVERVEITYRERDACTYVPLQKLEFRLRYLHRMPLGTPYTEVASRMDSLVRSLRRKYCGSDNFQTTAHSMTLVVDATGVGQPVVDLIRSEHLGCDIVPVYITGSEREVQNRDGWSVPKRDLITGLQLLYERGDLRMSSALPDLDKLLSELGEMRVRISDRGHESFAVWRNGAHDDLVLAVALAAWRAGKFKSPWGRQRLL